MTSAATAVFDFVAAGAGRAEEPGAEVVEETARAAAEALGRAAPGRGGVADAVQSAETALDLAMRFWVDQHGADPSEAQAAVIAQALAAAESASER